MPDSIPNRPVYTTGLWNTVTFNKGVPMWLLILSAFAVSPEPVASEPEEEASTSESPDPASTFVYDTATEPATGTFHTCWGCCITTIEPKVAYDEPRRTVIAAAGSPLDAEVFTATPPRTWQDTKDDVRLMMPIQPRFAVLAEPPLTAPRVARAPALFAAMKPARLQPLRAVPRGRPLDKQGRTAALYSF